MLNTNVLTQTFHSLTLIAGLAIFIIFEENCKEDEEINKMKVPVLADVSL